MSKLWFSAHNHSCYSALDGMSDIKKMVSTAVKNGQPALALTDHGLMSGSFQLYKECKKAGILPFPGEEFYIVSDVADKSAPRYHVGMFALSHEGYKSLVWLSSLSHRRDRYHHKPRIDFQDLAKMASDGLFRDVALTTGCYFGLLAQTLITKGHKAACAIARAYATWCPNTYVEIQHHDTPHPDQWDDTILAEALLAVADEVGLPVIVTQDSHYCDHSDKELHDFYKRIAYAGSTTDDGFPGDSYHLADVKWMKDHFGASKDLRRIWNEGLDSCETLVNQHRLTLPALDNYKFQMPLWSKTADSDLRKRCERILRLRIPVANRTVYEDRLKYELDVIKDAGFASYFLLVGDIVAKCRKDDILVTARGSANGALVCWLMGIGTCDPIKWELLFERFLTRDRGKPPDIDLDIEDTYRDRLVEWLSHQNETLRIGTFSTFKVDGDGAGSLVQQYLFKRRRELSPEEMRERYPHNSNIHTIAEEDPDDAALLGALHDYKLRKAPGTHAAGIILSSRQQPLHEYLPSMLIPSSGHYVSQMEMEDVEDAGYVKVDLLGSRSLRTIHVALNNIGRDVSDFCDWIPLNDTKTYTLLRRGRTDTGIFQFEGYSSAKGCREVGVKSIHDLILVNALYRPATINAGHKDTYVRNRANPKGITYLHPFYEEHLKETYAVPVYQEQVMSILRGLGFPTDDLNRLLKAIKASNDKVDAAVATFASLKGDFFQRCRDVGMDDATCEQSWDFLRTFSEYSFNRAHSTAYGLMGYWMAYMKVHHSLEFHAALLSTTAGTEKEAKYVAEARRVGVPLAKADVNLSDSLWSLDRVNMKVRRGLISIGGIGEPTAEIIAANRPYLSVDDMIEKLPARPVTGGSDWKKKATLTGVYRKLAEAGALNSLGISANDHTYKKENQ